MSFSVRLVSVLFCFFVLPATFLMEPVGLFIASQATASGQSPHIVNAESNRNGQAAPGGLRTISRPNVFIAQTGCASFTPKAQYFESAGSTGSITVTAPGNCAWTVTGNPGWVTINSGASGTGNGTVAYTLAANNSISTRQAILTISGQSFIINQSGSNGSCAITPIAAGQTINGVLAVSDCYSQQRGQLFPADRYSFTGTAGQRVAIRADSSAVDTFVYLIEPTGAAVASNDDGDSRTGARIPAGTGFFTLPGSGSYQIEVTSFGTTAAFGAYSVSLSIGSANCSYTVAPSEQSVAAAGGNGSIAVTVAGSGCNWTASSNADWMTITAGATGNGNGTVSFSVAANSGLTRTAFVIVAGQLVSITQTGIGTPTFARWDKQTSGTTEQLNHIYFLDDVQGWTVGTNSTARLTVDGGATWNPFTVAGPAQSLHSVRFFDTDLGWVGGEKLTATTTNGGLSWTLLEFATGMRYRLFPVNTSNAFTVGERDGGGFHASTVVIPFLGFGQETQTLATLHPLRDIYFFNAANGWSVGDNGQIFRLSKGGTNFNQQTGATTQNLNGIFALDLGTAWAVGDGGVILKTTNGGVSWQPQVSGVATALRDIHFINADRGWAVGDGGVILVTHNGGSAWSSEPSGVTANLRSVHANSINAVYAAGANGTIVKRSLCAFTLSVATASFEFGGGNGSFNVTTTAGCPWTATSNANWITINSGSTGNGNGTVSFTVAANSGPARTGTITVADQTFTVTQSMSCLSVTNIAPASGVVGTTVTITGANFTGVTAVKFANNVSATFTIVSDTQIATAVPAGAVTGPITINSQLCGDATTPVFTILQKPTITIAPPSPLIAIGQQVTFVATINMALPTGVSLSLNSSNPSVAPVSLNPSIPAGQTSAQFNVTGASAGTTTITVTLPALYGSGSASATLTVAAGFEADVSPRPNGNANGQITTTDWVQVGRFIAELDSAAAGSEFQRADCAPRVTRGDGRLTIIDWVQAGRYAAGLDPVTVAAGPTAPANQSSLLRKSQPQSVTSDATTKVRLVQDALSLDGSLTIELDALGVENALAFSLHFNPQHWRFASASAANGLSGAQTYFNTTQSDSVGVLLALPAGQSFSAGSHQVLRLNFTSLQVATASLNEFSFTDQSVERAVVSGNADQIPAEFFVSGSAIAANARREWDLLTAIRDLFQSVSIR